MSVFISSISIKPLIYLDRNTNTQSQFMEKDLRLELSECMTARRSKSIIRQMKLLMRNIQAHVRSQLQAQGHDVIDTRFSDVLAYVDPKGTNIVTLAERAGVTKQAMSKLVKEAEQNGLVTVSKDPVDSRALVVNVTLKALNIGKAVYDLSDKMLAELSAQFGEERISTFFSVMNDITKHYEQ